MDEYEEQSEGQSEEGTEEKPQREERPHHKRSFDGPRGGGSRGGGFNRDGPRGGGGFNREMHKATCADCGKECEVPFKPAQDRPVYCRDCYRNHKKF